MKQLFFILILTMFSPTLQAQKYAYGLEIAPSFNFQLLKAIPSNIRSSQSGKGFLIGGFIQKQLNDHSYIVSGLKFEYIGFNQKNNGLLIESYRIMGLSIPLNFKQEIGLTKNWFYIVGTGLNYNFYNQKFASALWVNVNPASNQWQPFLQAGLSYYPKESLEISALARYHFIDLWQKNFQELSKTKSKLASIDLALKFYF